MVEDKAEPGMQMPQFNELDDEKIKAVIDENWTPSFALRWSAEILETSPEFPLSVLAHVVAQLNRCVTRDIPTGWTLSKIQGTVRLSKPNSWRVFLSHDLQTSLKCYSIQKLLADRVTDLGERLTALDEKLLNKTRQRQVERFQKKVDRTVTMLTTDFAQKCTNALKKLKDEDLAPLAPARLKPRSRRSWEDWDNDPQTDSEVDERDYLTVKPPLPPDFPDWRKAVNSAIAPGAIVKLKTKHYEELSWKEEEVDKVMVIRFPTHPECSYWIDKWSKMLKAKE